ncbi:MAG: DsbA family oxidoreductase [Gammaproteobacteria bacterium]|jgi:predicted DsbA family dithiol-disulfide isomerase|nr:DsbA family oxidoreductase [Gammaproteobacteria bacterium]MBQ0773471.1 DsbA family oxidoreductase [Gammaproteobacteria bacterium]|tara:strand:- start:2946 stop:3587 length:642 start_codon:yes stop_codon:yes gene_type:complete
MMKKLQITMIHDLVCSWCPIGYYNIKTAAKNVGIDVNFNFIPFELNPGMGDEGELIADYFSRRFNWSERKLLGYQDSLIKTAATAGVLIDFSKRQYYYNTHKGHLLLHWSEQFGRQVELNEALIKAYFYRGLDISNADVLLDIAVQIGLDRDLASSALSSVDLERELERKIERQRRLNIESIPAFTLNNNVFISGSQSVSFFENALAPYVEKV